MDIKQRIFLLTNAAELNSDTIGVTIRKVRDKDRYAVSIVRCTCCKLRRKISDFESKEQAAAFAGDCLRILEENGYKTVKLSGVL